MLDLFKKYPKMGSIVKLKDGDSIGIIFYSYVTGITGEPNRRCYVLWPNRRLAWYDEAELEFIDHV